MKKTGEIKAISPMVWKHNPDVEDGPNILKVISNLELPWSPEYYVVSIFFGEKGFQKTADLKYKGLTKEILKSFQIIEIK
jgi:hypothetical protein